VSIAQTFIPSPLFVTERAVAKVRELVEDEGNPRLRLRVYVTGGGCSGFQYGFAFEEAIEDDDTIVEKDGIAVVVDALSFPYLAGSEIDYTEGLEGARFVVRNPNATSTCGCGSSFSV
jgi:iron-sulfur cluster insertion protein